jgi:hypothetical protein
VRQPAESRTTTMEPVPSVIAILLCDRIIEEVGTHKKSLVGIFDRITVPAPVQMPLAFYARLTDAEGKYKFRVNVMSLSDENLVMQGETSEGEIKSRLDVTEVGMTFPPVPFPTPGRYEFQLYGNDVYLGHATVHVAGKEGGAEDAGS